MTGQVLKTVSGAVATLIISNPARLNALTVAMWQALQEHFEDLSRLSTLRCVVIRGATPSAFSAGADISEFGETRTTYEQVVRFHEETVLGCLAEITACPAPVVAAIQGTCFGGGLEIAALCDLRIADASARFGAPVGQMGFPLAFAETQALVRLVGPAVAAELLIEGRILEARTAYEKGLVTRVVEDLEAGLEETVGNILRSGARAARSHKRQIRRLIVDPSPVSLEERMEVYGFADWDEYREGVSAFLSKASRRR